MFSHNELKKGIKFIFNNEPYEVLECSLMFKARGHSTAQAKIKNLLTGSVVVKTFHPSDSFEQAEFGKIKARFIYKKPLRQEKGQEEYFFAEQDNPANRFSLFSAQIGSSSKLLCPNQIVEGLTFQAKIVNISLPIKINLKVIEAPPGIKGDRSQAGNKLVTLEGGAKINAPLFIKEGDIVEINTESGQYVRRVEK